MLTLIHLLLIAMAPAAYRVEPLLLADSLDAYYGPTSFLALGNGTVLFVGPDESIRSVDPDDPASVEIISCDWEEGTPEWTGNTNTLLQASSPDGSTICFTQQVRFPDSMQIEGTFIPGPVIVVLCGPDGSNARIASLSLDIGTSPSFDFTSDSGYLFGGVLLGCRPTPEDFAAYVTRHDDSNVISGYLIDTGTAERTGGPDTLVNDGYFVNPWSDLAATGGYPASMVIDVVSREMIFEDPYPGHSGVVCSWVLPDAWLAEKNGVQVLRYADGTRIVNPGASLRVLAAFPDGEYVFSTDDSPEDIMLGNMDWEEFESPDAVLLDGLGDYELSYCRGLETPRGSWLVFAEGSRLYACELPVTGP
ncbi:MAG: hypothetical protein AVO35_08820 [Candidatus Aegiribacteria sp. MLS_C]|nr:MAG: hypothetical protein AVO35_08820 [Candidatus Aegiribacteria sp. MLS_C]